MTHHSASSRATRSQTTSQDYEKLRAALTELLPDYLDWKEKGSGRITVEVDKSSLRKARLALSAAQSAIAEPMRQLEVDGTSQDFYDADGSDGPAIAEPVGDGWKMVPVEPTEAMIEAWEKSKPYDGDYTDEKCATACWKDMVSAAPESAKP